MGITSSWFSPDRKTPDLTIIALRGLAAGIAVVFCLNAPVQAEMFLIENPAANIYNPATRMNNPKPLSPATQAVPQQPAVSEIPPAIAPDKQISEQKQLTRPAVPAKQYYYKTAGNYVTAAKRAFLRDDYIEFISITEDALRRLDQGSLKASLKTKQKLTKYKTFGYGLLEK